MPQIKSYQPPSLWHLYKTLVHPLSDILYKAERRGIQVDIKKTKELENRLIKLKNEFEKEFFEKYGFLNYNSSQDCIRLFIHQLKLEPIKYTKEKAICMDKSVLEAYATQGVEAAKQVRNLKRIDKILNTYIYGYIYSNENNGVIYPNFNIPGTVSGRLSSSKRTQDDSSFNIQNITNDIELINGEIISIRELFVPRKGYKFCHADASQSELRILGWYTQEPNLVYAAENNLDMHCANGSIIQEIPLEEFIRKYKENDKKYVDLRRECKNIGFAFYYDAKDKKIYEMLKGKYTMQQVAEKRKRIFENAKNIFLWKDTAYKNASEHNKEFYSCYGARRVLPDLISPLEYKKLESKGSNRSSSENEIYNKHEAALREGINFIIQNSSVYYVDYGMIAINDSKDIDQSKVNFLCQIHDSVDYEVEEHYADEFIKIAKPLLEKPKLPIDIKMRYDFEVKESFK